MPLALDKAAQDDVEFRRGLPLNFLRQAGLVYNCASSRKILIKSVKEKILKLVKYLDIDRAVDMMGAQFVTDALPPLLTEGRLLFLLFNLSFIVSLHIRLHLFILRIFLNKFCRRRIQMCISQRTADGRKWSP